tara:strand:+ start:2978 stop:3340 length:363 start_codon:yes stop_codon:yes gene_type:complete
MANVTYSDIRELIDLIDRRASGVKVLITRAPDDVAYINLIEVPPTQRGYGLGQRALNLICQTADARAWKLRLTPSGDLGSDYDRLVAWYAGSGFALDGAKHGSTMSREPEVLDHWAADAA